MTLASGGSRADINFALVAAGSITGTITDGNGVPFAGILVTRTLSRGLLRRRPAITAADGTYAIVGLAPVSYRVSASGSVCGFPRLSYPTRYYNRTFDFSAATPVAVTAGATTPDISFALLAAGSIAGKLTDNNGAGLAGMFVQASLENGCCSGGNAVTAADGTYTMTDLQVGVYRVSASGSVCGSLCVSYPTRYYNGTFDYSAATLVTVTAGETTPDINIALLAAGSISGTITDTNGALLGGIFVQAQRAVCCSFGSATTAADGTYEITNLTPGAYTVSASGSTCGSSPPIGSCTVYPQQYYAGTFDAGAATPVPVASGARTANIDLTLLPGGSIAAESSRVVRRWPGCRLTR